jgi:glycosyltransferase involved in cell wall biosynthesis
MKILQLCHKPPAPPKDGGCIAMNNITAGLMQAGHEVRLLTIYTHKHDLELENLSKEYIERTKIQGVHVDTRVNLVDAFSSLITQDSYNISRFFSADFDIKLSQILKKENFDIVHLESLFMTPYIATIRRFSKAKVVLRSHNLEYIIWERVAQGTKNPAKRAYLKYLSKKLKDYELDVITQMDGIASISKEDAENYRSLGLKKPLVNIPFGIDLEKYQSLDKEPEAALFHLGAMDWRPNIEGVLWFLDEVWPKVHHAHPKLKFYLAGRHMPKELTESNYPNVEILGEVPSAVDFMNSKQIMVVPLLSAGGIRVKIIEGMALKKNVISTSIGAEGINAKNPRDLHLAETPEDFVQAIDHLLQNPEAAKEQGIAARKIVEERFDNKVLTQQLVDFYKDLLS